MEVGEHSFERARVLEASDLTCYDQIDSRGIDEGFLACNTAQKWSFPLRIFSVNVTKSARNFEFGHTKKILNGKRHFLCSAGKST